MPDYGHLPKGDRESGTATDSSDLLKMPCQVSGNILDNAIVKEDDVEKDLRIS